MNKTLLLVLMIACLQTQASPQAPSISSTQTREVQGQILTSTYLPPIRLRFEANFKHIGSQKFILYERAQAEQFFFVDADNERRVRRMYWIQFEGYLPNVDATYDYPVTNTVTIEGQNYLVDVVRVPPNLPEVIKLHPESDSARALTFLLAKGYHFGQHLSVQRFVRLVDDARRNEIMLIYIEDAEIFPVPHKGDKNFWARGLKGFTVLKQ